MGLLLLCLGLDACGALQRVANTTLHMPSAPPTFGFAYTNAFPSIGFTNPVCIVTPPGETNRLFVVEKGGRIVVITNLAAPTRTIFMNISPLVLNGGDTAWSDERGMLGLDFHPGFATNRLFYVFYTGTTNSSAGTGMHDILASFQASAVTPNAGDSSTIKVLFAQYDEAPNHNAGDLHFGPDGYLYVSLGDEGGAEGQYGNCQHIDKDFFSGIMRLDVDKRPGNLPPQPHAALLSKTNYFVPIDNPFVGVTTFNGLAINTTTLRTEFWAVGLRNPWRFSFDIDGTLYCGDVGQGTREEIDIITKGANYGWNYFEGFFQRTNNAQLPSGFANTLPLFDYTRFGAYAAVIGGRVYRGQRFSQLYGAYVYADSDSGKIFSLRYSGTNVTENTLLLTDDLNGSSDAGVSAFGVDPSNGDLLYADVQNGTDSKIKRIIYNSTTNGAPLPALLDGTGAFTNLTTLAIAPGIVPYDLNAPFWSDNAIKTRWFSVPNTNLTVGFAREGNYNFPTGSVWIKHFELELTNGVAASRRRLETRLIVKNTNGVYGVTYRWGTSVTNAALVAEEGLDESFTIDNGSGVLRTQIWHYPSRSECLNCHTPGGGFALGFNTAQLNRDFNYPGQTTNQIAALSQAGYFNTNVTGIHTLRSLANVTNTDVSQEYRVRSYLAANCAQCHQPGGLARALWDARIATTTGNSGIIKGALMNDFGNSNNRVIAPGSLANSVLFTRISTPGILRMPPIDSTVLDTNAISLVASWITNDLPSYLSFSDWQTLYFASTNGPTAGAAADPDGDGAQNYLEYLTGTDPLQSSSCWRIGMQLNNPYVQVVFPQISNRAFEVQARTNIFDSSAWTPLDVPGNEPYFARTNRVGSLNQPLNPSGSVFYRVRVIEP
jgi:uncharacterized repeat protein (TIGR03806 family)